MNVPVSRRSVLRGAVLLGTAGAIAPALLDGPAASAAATSRAAATSAGPGRPAGDRQLRHLGGPAAVVAGERGRQPTQQDHRASHGVSELDRLQPGPRVRQLARDPEPAHGRQRLARLGPALHQQPGRPTHRGPARQPVRAAARADHGAGRALRGAEQPGHRHRERRDLRRRAAAPAALWDSLVVFCAFTCQQYGIPASQIYGHKDFASTQCPGLLHDRLPELRTAVAGYLG